MQRAAAQAELTPSALIQQWVHERLDDPGAGDLAARVERLERAVFAQTP